MSSATGEFSNGWARSRVSTVTGELEHGWPRRAARLKVALACSKMGRMDDEERAAGDGAVTTTSRRPSPRPRRPTRWPAVVGGLGELLVTLGVLVGLFVVWQVWWTDVEVRDVQSERIALIEAQPAPTSEPPAPRPARPPVLASPETVGTTFASLRVPRWGDDYVMPISEGVSRSAVLDTLGIGHYPGTAMPGEVGNFAVSGHRVGFGRPFYEIADLRTGDALVVRTTDAWYVYRVSASRIVAPTEVAVIAPVPGQPGVEATEAAITLTTCHPLFSTRQRYVVHGALESWQPVAEGSPAALAPDRTATTATEGT